MDADNFSPDHCQVLLLMVLLLQRQLDCFQFPQSHINNNTGQNVRLLMIWSNIEMDRQLTSLFPGDRLPDKRLQWWEV